MSVSHWELLRAGDTTYLSHKNCPANIKQDELPTCAKKVLGRWICVSCGDIAPDEIGFTCDLAETYTYGDSDFPGPLPPTYTPDLYDHKGEWLNVSFMNSTPMPDPVIATPQEYLHEKIKQEQEEESIREYEKGFVTIWKDWEEEFKTSSPAFVAATGHTGLDKAMAKIS